MGKHILLLFQEQVIGGSELLYFADVCAGPGGFSEYVLWRKKWDSKGFGFTLKGPCDFKLDEFFAAHSELFEPHYGKLYLFFLFSSCRKYAVIYTPHPTTMQKFSSV